MLRVYMVSNGGHKQEVFEGTEEECKEFYIAHNGGYKDENDFVWDLEID